MTNRSPVPELPMAAGRSVAGFPVPGYWDVETTFWLRWRLGSARLEETVD
jgi:hypothetical protein